MWLHLLLAIVCSCTSLFGMIAALRMWNPDAFAVCCGEVDVEIPTAVVVEYINDAEQETSH